MARKNNKIQKFSYENAIKKSNELSMAKLSQGLTLNQMQLLAYAIFSTQKSGETKFDKTKFEDRFNLKKYQTIHAKEDSQRILDLKFSIEDLENNQFEYYNVFQSIKYNNGLFRFKWTEDMVPHILELKEKYVSTDLSITSQFKSGFSWILYDYLRANYGYWHKLISKEALMHLFGVENRKTYKRNTSDFKRMVLDVSITEINKYTELQVRYNEERKGRSITGFDLIWSTGKREISATRRQIKELESIVNVVIKDALVFVDLNKEENRKRAIYIVEEMRKMLPFTVEPISITYDKADMSIQKGNSYLRELNNMSEEDNKDVYYNWLDKDSK